MYLVDQHTYTLIKRDLYMQDNVEGCCHSTQGSLQKENTLDLELKYVLAINLKDKLVIYINILEIDVIFCDCTMSTN